MTVDGCLGDDLHYAAIPDILIDMTTTTTSTATLITSTADEIAVGDHVIIEWARHEVAEVGHYGRSLVELRLVTEGRFGDRRILLDATDEVRRINRP